MVLGAGAATQYRDFMDSQGRTIRGRILRYDAKKRAVTMERDNKKMVTVPLTIFSDKDQEYILEWEFNKVFLSQSSFKIEAKRKREKDKDGSYSGGGSTSTKVENTIYEIILQNKSTSTLEGLELEYCIYYEQEKHGNGKTIDEEGVRCGTLKVGAIRPKSSKDLMTEAVSIYTSELNAGWIYSSGTDNKISGDVRGLWVRVNMTTKSGNVITRDFCMPDSLSNSKAWTTTSKNVGKNRGR